MVQHDDTFAALYRPVYTTHLLKEEVRLVLLLVRVHPIDGVDHGRVGLVEVRVADSDGEACQIKSNHVRRRTSLDCNMPSESGRKWPDAENTAYMLHHCGHNVFEIIHVSMEAARGAKNTTAAEDGRMVR